MQTNTIKLHLDTPRQSSIEPKDTPVKQVPQNEGKERKERQVQMEKELCFFLTFEGQSFGFF